MAAMGLFGAVLSAPASAITVDGSLADWNVTVSDFAGPCGTDATGSCIGSNFAGVGATPGLAAATINDKNDVSNNYLHIPPYLGGGQNYDVEFMAAAIQGTTLYMAISTGQRPDNGVPDFSPGDIRMTLNNATKFGIEVGGGLGHNGGPAVGAIATGAAGTTYNTSTSGHTTGLAATAGAQTAGTIWKNVTWLNDNISNALDGGDKETQFQINGGSTLQTTANYVYTLDAAGNQHAVIELAFDMALLDGITLDGTSVLNIEWMPNCGNDMSLIVVIPEQRDIQTPTPAALPLFLVGLGGLLALRRRKAA